MNQEKRESVAFFRYQVIAPLLNRDPGEPLCRAIGRLAEKVYEIPGSAHPRSIAAKTIEEWYYLYRKGGIDLLKPARRRDTGESKKIKDQIATAIEEILSERPYLDGQTVLKELIARQIIAPGEISLSAFYRFRKARKLSKDVKETGSCYRAFAFEYPGDCYQTDVLYGPTIPTINGKRRRTYLIAVIDDCTRVVPHAQFYFDQNLASFLDVLKQAILKRGAPRRLYLDNAFVFRSVHLMRLTATLGIHLIHSRPYRPEGRAKVERYFRTVRTQFLSRIDPDTVSLEELNSLFWAWLEGEYHTRTHRSLEEAPLDKWLRLAQHVRRLPEEINLDQIFLHEATRRVLLDGTFYLDKRRFEAPVHLAGQKVQVHFDPADLRRVYLSSEGKHQGVAYPVDLEANARVRREETPEKQKPSLPQKPLESLYHLRDQFEERKNGPDHSATN